MREETIFSMSSSVYMKMTTFSVSACLFAPHRYTKQFSILSLSQ